MSGHHTPRRKPGISSADNSLKYDSIIPMDPDILPSDIRQRRRTLSNTEHTDEDQEGQENGFVMMPPENAIEAHRMVNNYKFGFKKWKSHVTSRPLNERSEIVQSLYADVSELKPVKISTVRPTNVLYVFLFGWWMALIYILVALFMFITVIGYSYAPYCWKLAKYFIWPFGKFVYQVHPHSRKREESQKYNSDTDELNEETVLIEVTNVEPQPGRCSSCKVFWTHPRSYLWLLLGCPILLVVHGIVSAICWLFVITIPIAKVNLKTITQILWMPPDQLSIGDSSTMSLDPKRHRHEIIMYTHQSVNFYYYKYTIDGMNVILVNLLVFVVLSLVIGYTDEENKHTSGVTKCVLAILAIVPLTYYIGMGIISISAQSSFAVGAVLNATFGSGVELILYIVAMLKGVNTNSLCYNELVRSALTGTLVGSILFIPGLCMIVGGIKYRSQRFNPKSASVTAIFLFVAIVGVFCPTLFSKVFGDLACKKCETNMTTNVSVGFQCTGCRSSVLGLDGDDSLYKQHIQPLVYGCGLILPVIYIIGVVFTLKTHSSYLYDEFYEQLKDDCNGQEHHGAPQWSRIKSVLILLGSAILIAVCADLVTNNIEAFLKASGVSEYFIGVTMIAMIPELPEIINGVQFALQNNVNLGIEIGTNTAIQVCLIQVPVLILINLIYPDFNFLLVFNDVHLFAVIFSVIVINYVFQDGKSDYFQGILFIYILLY